MSEHVPGDDHAEIDALDGTVAAPDNHRVLFENDRVRVVESLIRVGDGTPEPNTVENVGDDDIRVDVIELKAPRG